jgi:hypothetical protein
VGSSLTAAGALVAIAALALIVICWKTRTALGGVLGVVAIALVVIALTAKPTGDARGAWLVGAFIALLMGVVLYVLGHLVGRLLDADPDAGP